MLVEIENEEFQVGVKALRFSLVEKLSLQKGNRPPTTMDLMGKLAAV